MTRATLHRAFYSARISEFLTHSDEQVIGTISQHHSQNVVIQQTNAWAAQCQILRPVLKEIAEPNDVIFFELGIPRMGKRADVVLVLSGVVFVLEFKVGATQFHNLDVQQTVDYALDLKHFHSGSHSALIFPILVATDAELDYRHDALHQLDPDGLGEVLLANRSCLSSVLADCLETIRLRSHVDLELLEDGLEWAKHGYKPTPTIVQAAQALYQGHDVREISRSDAGAENLTATSEAIAKVIEKSKREGLKSICFVTGVPGAGKTLAGLNIATERMNSHEEEHAVFLSGNGPLVAVLREALARDERQRLGIKKNVAERKAEAFIQNIHHFRDENLRTTDPPVEKVVVFDEAQRAWDRAKTSQFMKTKRGQIDFDESEPEFLIGVMDRHEDWCVIVALIGGGQEINTGEAGLSEWFTSIKNRFPDWEIHYSDYLRTANYVDGVALTNQLEGTKAFPEPAMHLAVAIRSFRAETLSDLVEALLDNKPEVAKILYEEIKDRYPIYVSRDLDLCRQWLKQRTRGGELCGVLASSGALRLRPRGLNVKAKVDPAVWFLNGPDDVRSCQYLEEVATEFDVQGLELDWTCVAWDGNLRYSRGAWSSHRFFGTKWQNVVDSQKRIYLKNAYRVLLTRARQGMVIYVPAGDSADPTRDTAFYDGTYEYFVECGIEPLISQNISPL